MTMQTYEERTGHFLVDSKLALSNKLKKMKKIISYFLGLVVLPLNIFAQELTKSEAWLKVQELYEVQVINDYEFSFAKEIVAPNTIFYASVRSLESPSAKSWLFFVDKSPSEAWEHDCEWIFVETISGKLHRYIERIPPAIELEEISHPETSLAPTGSFIIPSTFPDWVIPPILGENKNTHAVIINGGGNLNMNAACFWNDCAYMYSSLVHIHQVPKDNIYVIMSDGISPNLDIYVSGSYESSPLDLDGDGMPDIEYPATKLAIKSVLEDLSTKLTPSDNLIIFVTDHGGTNGAGQNYIYVWPPIGSVHSIEDTKIQDFELAEMIAPCKAGLISVVLGQCYSGGFIDDLQGEGRIITTSAPANFVSFTVPEYSVFFKNWIKAFSQKDHMGIPFNSDLNNDGFLSMKEAFDNVANNLPQYNSTPHLLGHRSSSWGEYDLFTRDSSDDIGKEPLLETAVFWNSPDIWIRNENDSIELHQNPSFSQNPAYVYVKVRNRGMITNNDGDKLRVYWSLSSVGMPWDQPSALPHGSVGEADIPILSPGEECTLVLEWNVPNPNLLFAHNINKQQIALTSRIISSRDPVLMATMGEVDIVRQNNNISQKNVSIINLIHERNSEQIFKTEAILPIANFKSVGVEYDLVLSPVIEKGRDNILDEAEIELTLGDSLLEKLVGEDALFGFELDDNFSNKLKVNSDFCVIRSLKLDPNQVVTINLNVNFLVKKLKNTKELLYRIVIKDSKSKRILGGQDVCIQKNQHPFFEAKVQEVKDLDGVVYLCAKEIDSEAIYNWYSSNGELLGSGLNITTTNNRCNSYRLEVIRNNDQYKDYTISAQRDFAPKAVNPVQNLTYSYDKGLLSLLWDAPEQARRGTVLVDETFIDVQEWSLPVGWKTIDGNGDLLSPFVQNNEPTVFPDGSVWTIGYNDNASCYSYSKVSNGQESVFPDDYLITPLVEGAKYLSYRVCNMTDFYLDHYGIYVSFDEATDPSTFTCLYEDDLIGADGVLEPFHQSTWQHKQIELPAGTRYVIFRHFNTPGPRNWCLRIDDVLITTEAPQSDYTYSIYRNGELIEGNWTSTSYFQNIEQEEALYCVRALLNGEESEAVCLPVTTSLATINSSTFSAFGQIGSIAINADKAQVRIFNLQGQLCYSGEVLTQKQVSLAKGVYVVKMWDERDIATYKVRVM